MTLIFVHYSDKPADMIVDCVFRWGVFYPLSGTPHIPFLLKQSYKHPWVHRKVSPARVIWPFLVVKDWCCLIWFYRSECHLIRTRLEECSSLNLTRESFYGWEEQLWTSQSVIRANKINNTNNVNINKNNVTNANIIIRRGCKKVKVLYEPFPFSTILRQIAQ